MSLFYRTSSLLGLLFCVGIFSNCTGRKQPLERYAEAQREKIQRKETYVQAEFDFAAQVYEPTRDDIDGLRAAWVEHGMAFPESKPITDITTEMQSPTQKVVLISLFMSAWENADLKNKSLGWAVYPVPNSITELSETDIPLRTLMPVLNPWARYYLVKFGADTWLSTSQIVISNRTSKIELPVRR